MAQESRDGSNKVVLTPPLGKWSATVIFAHGLGDSADGWVDTLRDVSKQLPWVKFIIPSAPSRPITLNGGMSMPGWFDIASLSPADANSMDGVDTTVAYINELVEAEIANGISYNRIVFAGFSQGGAISLFGGLSRPKEKKLAGILAMSGFMPNPGLFAMNGSEDVPVFMTHGDADPVVNVVWGQSTLELIKSKGCTDANIKVYPGLPHSIHETSLRDSVAFLLKVLPNDTSMVVKVDPSSMSVKELKAAIRDLGLQGKAVGLTEKSELIELVKSAL